MLSKAIGITLITPASTLTKPETLKSYSLHKVVIAIRSRLSLRSDSDRRCCALAAGSHRRIGISERSKVLRGFVNFIGLRMISPLDYSSALNRHALIFNAKAAHQNAHTRDETSSSLAGANHALDQCCRYFHHDRQRMEDLQRRRYF
ncbi:MAG: hypothetical protein WCD69_09285 [Xanthobacteraceae bacterium]